MIFVCVTLSSLGACSSGGDDATATGATSEVAPPSGADTTVGTAATGTSEAFAEPVAADSCELISADDVRSTFGGSVAEGVFNADGFRACDFDVTGITNAGPVPDIGLTVSVTQWENTLNTPHDQDDVTDAVTFSSPGDGGWTHVGGTHVFVGTTEIVVTALSFDATLDQVGLDAAALSLATLAIERLGGS